KKTVTRSSNLCGMYTIKVHSVLVSGKAISSRDEEGMKKKAVTLDLVTAIRSGGKQPYRYRTSSDHQRVLPSDKKNMKSK
nr:basic-leucine zipper domain-containing protein [Tanacetum cinerariifolium]